MKIAISASNPDLSSPVDPRFGRCPYFLIVDPETMKFEALENPNVSSASGAGIQSAQFISDKEVQAVLTGSCGQMPSRHSKQQGLKSSSESQEPFKKLSNNINQVSFNP